MVATHLLLVAVLMLWAAPVPAEPIRIAYSGVSASGTPVGSPRRKASSPGTDWKPIWSRCAARRSRSRRWSPTESSSSAAARRVCCPPPPKAPSSRSSCSLSPSGRPTIFWSRRRSPSPPICSARRSACRISAVCSGVSLCCRCGRWVLTRKGTTSASRRSATAP